MVRWFRRLLGRGSDGGGGSRREDGRRYEEDAFYALVRKFQSIRYLVEQKPVLDIIEKAPVAICITNERHIYEYVNTAYCRLYGYTYDELVGESFTKVVPEESRGELVSLHDRFMNREYELEGQWDVVRKDGRPLRILANAAYVVDEQGNPKKVTFVLDVTERTRASADFQCLCRNADLVRRRLLEIADRVGSEDVDTLAAEIRSLASRIDRGLLEPEAEDG